MAKLIELLNTDEVKEIIVDRDGNQCYEPIYRKKPFFKASDGERFSLSDLELVCVEPITVSAEKLKSKAHEELALNTAREYGLPYVRLSKYCLRSTPAVEFIGGKDCSVHTYLAQFYRVK